MRRTPAHKRKANSGDQLATSKRLAGMTADESRQLSPETTRLATETQDLWERKILFQIASQWQWLAVHRAVERWPTT